MILPLRNDEDMLRRTGGTIGIDPEIDEVGLRRGAATGEKRKDGGEAEEKARAHGRHSVCRRNQEDTGDRESLTRPVSPHKGTGRVFLCWMVWYDLAHPLHRRLVSMEVRHEV